METLQDALVRTALHRHAHELGRYVFINKRTGNATSGTNGSDAIARYRYWYGDSAPWDEGLGLAGFDACIIRIPP